jgi:uncharacterized protein YqhQ
MNKEKLPNYGGQALIEGVVMRGSMAVSAAMRSPDGSIIVQTDDLSGVYKSPFRKIPFIRGILILWDSLGLGFKYLTLSANIQSGESEKIEGPAAIITIGISVLVSVLLFMMVPAALASWIENHFLLNSWIGNLLEGGIRLFILIGYIIGIGRMAEIQRVFAYHGAEHKTINAFESGVDLIPENVKKCSLEHPRCGTSFLLTLVLFSILLFGFLGPMSFGVRQISRILLLPILAGIAYEYIRWFATNIEHPIVKILIRPNMALQKLTTREPDESMLEVAITAFKSMMDRENFQLGKSNLIEESTS